MQQNHDRTSVVCNENFMASIRYYASIGLEGLRKVMTDLRKAHILAEIQTQYL
jgi:hypothetical protein